MQFKFIVLSQLLLQLGIAAQAATFTVSPNPIQVTDNCCYGKATLYWTAMEAPTVQIWVGPPPTGSLFTVAGNVGSTTTGEWVVNGTTFYLVNDATGAILGTTTAYLQLPTISADPNPYQNVR